MDLINAYNEEFDNIVFLDIDGVMNNQYNKGEYIFTKETVEVLNYLYEKFNIKIVLSSSWRTAYSFTFLQTIFKENNIEAPLIDKTPRFINKNKDKRCNSLSIDELEAYEIDEIYTREYEIFDWISVFRPKHYVIIDDFKMKNKELFNHQILTYNWGDDESFLGLRKFHINKIEKYLKFR